MATAESANLVEVTVSSASELESCGEEEGNPSTCRSLLDVLKSATTSDLARKRKIEKPKGPVKKWRSSVAINPTDPKTVSPADCVSKSFLLKLGMENYSA